MGKRILIVDDMVFIRASLKKILESAGYEVVGEAQDGEEGVVQYKKLLPDLVTLDLTMPKKDGLQALEEIKKINPSAKVIMISAMGQQKNVLKAIQIGAKNFIVKPFKADKVLDIIAPLLRQ